MLRIPLTLNIDFFFAFDLFYQVEYLSTPLNGIILIKDQPRRAVQ
jgi:hypothetical protein